MVCDCGFGLLWVACLLADTLLFVACNVCFGGFGVLIVGWLLVCDTFGFCLIVLFLYNVISFGVLVISFCLLLIGLGVCFHLRVYLGVYYMFRCWQVLGLCRCVCC